MPAAPVLQGVRSSSPRSAKRPFDVSIPRGLVRLCRQGLVSLRCRGRPHRSCATHKSASGFSSARQHDRSSHRRHVRAVPPLLRPSPLHQGRGSALRRRDRRAEYRLADDRDGSHHVGVATDHVIESRNRLWSGYKTGTASSPHSSRNSTRSRKHSTQAWLYGP